MWHHLCLTSSQSEVLLTGTEKYLDMPSTAITQYHFSIGKGQIIGEEILGFARFLMFVVLDNSKRACAKTWVLHLETSHVCIQFAIVMALILGQLLDFVSFVFVDDPGVVPQTCDELDTQFVKETQILFASVPIVECEI